MRPTIPATEPFAPANHSTCTAAAPPLLVHDPTAQRDHVHQNGMRKVVAVAWAAVLVAGCGAVDGSETALPEPDFAPSIVLDADGDTITASDPAGDEVEPDACQGDVGMIRNTGGSAGRWVGTGGFDTGILDPDDAVTLVFRDAGTVEWRAAPTAPGGNGDDRDEGSEDGEPSGPVVLTLSVREC